MEIRHRKRSLALLIAGISLLLFAGFLWYEYLISRQINLPIARDVLGASQPLYSSSIYGIDQPLGIAISPDGQRIYATEDGGNRLIRVFDNRGNPQGTLAPPGTSPSTRKPTYVAVSPEGLAYVADLLRPGIDVYSKEGTFLTTFSPPPIPVQSWRPLALAFDRTGNLYVADTVKGRQRVLVLDHDGTIIRQINDDFNYPNGIAVDANGRIFVADSGNRRIKVYGPDGQPVGQLTQAEVGQRLVAPRGLAFDSDGRLAVVDTFDHSVKIFTGGLESAASLPLKSQFSLGTRGSGDGQFSYPNSIAVFQGKLFITDRQNNRIQVWY